jgi:di/tripeptidase
LIVTDGTTLLGADDKAGIAEIMSFGRILSLASEVGASCDIHLFYTG